MPKTKCRCGSILDDDDATTTTVYRVFSESDWEAREEERDWRKQIPFTVQAWECKICGTVYVYRLDEDVPSKVLVPDEGKKATS
jgi:hypothetical protein